MKRKLLRIAVALAGAYFLTACAVESFLHTPKRALAVVRARDLAPGNDRTLTYRIYLGSLIPFGTITITRTRRDGAPAYAIEALSRGSVAHAFIDARAAFASLFDAATGMPQRYVETTRVNGKTKSKSIIFDRQTLTAASGERRIKITPQTYDPVGGFMAVLERPFTDNRTETVEMLSKRDIYVLKAHKKARTDGALKVGIDVHRADATSNHGATFDVWLTREQPRVPLLFRSWTPAGFVTVILTDIRPADKEEAGS
ncbi:MAG: DUF3108 domain-containing protein [Deltaproteobacteria bacterium]